MDMTSMKTTNKAKLITILGALVLLGAAIGATAGSAVDKEMTASLSGDSERVEATVEDEIDIDGELAQAAHAELFADAQLDVRLQHELIETVALSADLEEQAELMTDLSATLPAEQRAEIMAQAEQLHAASAELRMIAEAQLDALDAGSADLLAAIELGDEAAITGALEDQIELTGELEAELQAGSELADDIVAQADALNAVLEAGAMAHIDLDQVAEFEHALTGVTETAGELQTQIEVTVDAHVDAVRALVASLGLFVDLDLWLDANADLPLVGTATAGLDTAVSGTVAGLLGSDDEDADGSDDSGDSGDTGGSGDSDSSHGSHGDDDNSSSHGSHDNNGSHDSHDNNNDNGTTVDTSTQVCAGPDRVTVDHGSEADSTVVQWTAMAQAEGYNVYRSEAGGEYELVATLEGENRFEDTDVEHGTTYEYRVTAIVEGEETEHCTTVEIAAIPVFTTILAAVGAAGAGLGGYAFLRRRP